MATLGVVGGIGPEATIDYYRRLLAGYRDRHPRGRAPSVLVNSIDAARLLSLAGSADRGPLIDYLVESLQPLGRAGVRFALFSANTPHVVFDEVSDRAPMPLLSMPVPALDTTAIHVDAAVERLLSLEGDESA